jgi:hypothetical protein
VGLPLSSVVLNWGKSMDQIASQVSSEQSVHKARNERITSLLNIVVSVLTVVGVLFSVFIYFYDKKSRDIRVVILDSAAFLQNRADFGKAVSVNVGDKKVEQLWYVRLRYENFGKLPIKKDEIETSTHIRFAGSEVLTVSVADRRPENLGLTITNATDSIELIHGLMNPGDYAVLDILVSGPKIPNVTCDYRIADIADCLVKDESAASREVYVVGMKVNDNLALLAVSFAFLASLLASGVFAYVVGNTIYQWARKLRAKYRVKSIEEALALFGIDFWDGIKNLKLAETHVFNFTLEPVIKLAGDRDSTISQLLDSARSQPVSDALAHEIQDGICQLVNNRTKYYLFSYQSKHPGKMVDFEEETIPFLISSRYRIDSTTVTIGLPLLILACNVAFVCAGPLRTLTQKLI